MGNYFIGPARLATTGHGRVKGEMFDLEVQRIVTDLICAICGKPIAPTENKLTIRGVIYHTQCWDRKERRRKE